MRDPDLFEPLKATGELRGASTKSERLLGLREIEKDFPALVEMLEAPRTGFHRLRSGARAWALAV
jgi:hypothetical protein